MGVAARGNPFYRRLDGKIARDLFPNEMESVIREPHVFTATGQNVGCGRGIERCRTGFADRPNGSFVREHAEVGSADIIDNAEEDN
jgi:hypothetical protein